jgi:hypothetical protein
VLIGGSFGVAATVATGSLAEKHVEKRVEALSPGQCRRNFNVLQTVSHHGASRGHRGSGTRQFLFA